MIFTFVRRYSLEEYFPCSDSHYFVLGAATLVPKAALGTPMGLVLSETKAIGVRAQMVAYRWKKRTIGD